MRSAVSIPPIVGIEVISLFVIVVCTLFIFFKTQNLSKLTSHRGISFFRKGILFFGLSYIFKLLIFLSIFFKAFLINFREFHTIFLFLNFIGVLYLFFSLIWKKAEEFGEKIKMDIEYLIYFIGIIPFFLSNLLHTRFEFLYLFQTVFFVFFLYVLVLKFFEVFKSKKKSKSLIGVYFLLFISWILGTFVLRYDFFLDINKRLISPIIALLFVFILFKVLRRFRVSSSKKKLLEEES